MKMPTSASGNLQRATPRRKFDWMANSVKINTGKFFKDSDNFDHLFTKSFKNRYTNDIRRERLFVEGTQFDDICINMVELIEWFKLQEPPRIEEQATGKRLAQIPVFYFDRYSPYGMNGNTLHIQSTGKQLLEGYQRCEKHHKEIETHHPGTPGWFRNGSAFIPSKIIEAIFDIYNSLLRKYTVASSYFKLLDILKNKPFSDLNVTYVYAALMHLQIRGVASSEILKASSNWRYNKTQQQLWLLHQQFCIGCPNEQFISAYKYEIFLHQKTIDLELKRIRAKKCRHDFSKFGLRMTYYYAWRWGVYEQLTSVNKYRAEIDCVEGKFTMLSTLGASLGESMRPAIRKEVDEAIPRVEAIKDDLADKVKHTIELESEGLISKSRNLMQEFFINAKEVTDDMLGKFTDKAKELVGSLPSSMEEISNVLGLFKNAFEEVTKHFTETFQGIIGSDFKLDIMSLIHALKYYILLINVDNSFLKGTLFMLMLNSFGAIGPLYRMLMKIVGYIFGSVETEKGEEPAQFTSGMDWISSLFSNMKSLSSVMIGMLGSLFSGRMLSKFEFTKLLASCANVMKNFHFIGSGMRGIVTIFQYFRKIFNIVVKWVSVHIFGQIDEEKKLARDVLSWVLRVRYFVSDEGLKAIRLSTKCKQEAKDLFPRGQALLAMVGPSSTKYSRELSQDIHRVWKDVLAISNFITRLEATSDFRPTMFHIQLVGAAGIGKSTLVRSLSKVLLKNLFDLKENSTWSYNPNLEYFDGYKGQRIMIVDDVFRYNEPKHMSTLIGLITNTPVILPMANLEDKGTFLESEIMISTTNMAYPSVKDLYCLDAIYRRRHMLVEVKMDDRVKNQSTGQFDELLFNKFYPGQDKKMFPHLKFNLLKPCPTNDLSSRYEADSGSYAEMLARYAAELEELNGIILGHKGQRLPAKCLYGTGDDIPDGIEFPCEGWSFEKLMLSMMSRFRAFRHQEGLKTNYDKYQEASINLAEIDCLLNQEASLPGGQELPRVKLLEKYFKIADLPDVDELDDYVMQHPDIASELEEISPEEIANEVVGKETASEEESIELIDSKLSDDSWVDELTGEFTMNLAEENKRRLDILRKKNREMPTYDPNSHILEWKKFTTEYISDEPSTSKKEVVEEGIPIVESWTRFDEFDRVGMTAFYRQSTAHLPDFSGCKTMEEKWQVLKEAILSWTTIPQPWLSYQASFLSWIIGNDLITPLKLDILNEICKNPSALDGNNTISMFFQIQKLILKVIFKQDGPWCEMSDMFWGQYMIFPKSDEFNDSEKGRKTRMLIHFLQMCKRATNGVLYFVPEKRYIPEDVQESFKKFSKEMRFVDERGYLTLHKDGKPYKVKYDDALIWSANPLFSEFVTEILLFGTLKQDKLIEEAKFRNKYFGTYTIQSIRQKYKNTLLNYPLKALEVIASPAYKIFRYSPFAFYRLFGIGVLIGSVYIFKQIAGLFFPNRERPTSKYLHRGPPSNIKYHGRFTSGSNQALEESVTGLFRRNIRQIRIWCEAKQKLVTSQAVFSGQYFIFNKHSLIPFDKEDELLISVASPHYHNDTYYPITLQQIVEDDGGDLALGFCKFLPSSRSIVKHFLTQKQYDAAETTNELIFLSVTEKEQNLAQHQALRKMEKLSLKGVTMNQCILVSGSTIVGKSGSAVIYPSNVCGDFKMIGIQAWEIGNYFDSKIAVQVITQEKYLELEGKLNQQLVEIPIQRAFDFEDCEVEGLDACFTSQEYNNVVTTTHYSIGTVGSTDFRKTEIAKYMDFTEYESKRVPAILNPLDPNLAFGSKIHPLNSSLNKYFKNTIQPFNVKLLDRCTGYLKNWIKNSLDKTEFRTLEFAEIITGTREDGSNPMDLRSSPGLPYVLESRHEKGKRDYFFINEEGILDYADKRIVEEYDQFSAMMMKGIIPWHVSYDFPKDELRPVEKALGSVENDTPPKTRSVTCMNMLFIMLWRELTLDMWASFHRRADGWFPFCPGINPEGPEWNNAFYYLNQHPNCVDFDVSNWDGFVSPQLIFEISKIICYLCKYKQNSPEELAIRAMLTEVIFGYVQYGKVVYQKYRGIISGFPGTAEVNSLIHILLLVYIYFALAVNTGFDTFEAFKNNVAFLVYGDDIIISFSDNISDWFNGLTIAQTYRDIGYPITSADKSQNLVKSKLLLDCKFLKSTWNELLPTIWFRKMDLDVAYDLLYWQRSKQHPRTQLHENAIDALRIAFGHGRQEYEKFLQNLNSWLKLAQLESIELTYDDLLNDHLERYYS